MHPRQAGHRQFGERSDESSCVVGHQSDFDFNSSGTQLGDATAVDMSRRIDGCHDDSADACGNDRPRTGRCLAEVAARFERHEQRGPARRFTRSGQRHHFRVRPAKSLVPAFAHNSAIVSDDDGPNGRIGFDETDAVPREFKRATHGFFGGGSRGCHGHQVRIDAVTRTLEASGSLDFMRCCH